MRSSYSEHSQVYTVCCITGMFDDNSITVSSTWEYALLIGGRSSYPPCS
ncbi:unnamed protein product [Ascophyllum nodosum]